MTEHVPFWWPLAGYALGFAMGSTTGPRFALYSKWLRRCRMSLYKGSQGPRQPAPGMRRVYYDMPSTIAECGGPCSVGGPECCDCGALWRDVPIEPQPPRGRVTDAYGRTIGYQPLPQGGTPNPPPTDP